jgi:beta-mannosidase
MALVRASTHAERRAIAGWELAADEAGGAPSPDALEARGLAWTPAAVPGTAASALLAARKWSMEDRLPFDAKDWWYRAAFAAAPRSGGRQVLRLSGLATSCDAWLNGRHVLRSDNMFHRHELDVTELLREENTLALRFGSLDAALRARRPRPRWRTRLVAQQQLRWHRTTLLGRIPAWTPPAAPVGPWRAAELETQRFVCLEEARVRSSVEKARGVVDVALRLRPIGPRAVPSVEVAVGSARASLAVSEDGGGLFTARGQVALEDAPLWWPHTHGPQPLFEVRAAVRAGGEEAQFDLGRTGFRSLEQEDDGGFGLRINGVGIFCRGATWTPLDAASLNAAPEATRAALEAVRAAGMNMVRLSGTMVYEDAAFYDACDELGILVWQDFMFANMDYPAADEGFAASVRREASELLDRLDASPALAVLCGGSEVEQQAAMMGLPRDQWTSPLFSELLPGVARERRPDVPYVSSTPTGGALPFHVDSGVAHYFGVGAYLRPLEDARRAGVRFAAECLAFANVPCDQTLDELLGDGQAPPHHPRWKERVPRDAGPGWDFDDVRDHYLRALFEVDPERLRYADGARYLELGRVATGEAMARTFAEWRRRGSTCRGALIWLLRDLWPGAGWGVIDARSRPKAAYWILRRALQPVALFATDEGLNGVELHAVNESAEGIEATVRLELIRRGEVVVAAGEAPLSLPARRTESVRGDALLTSFCDTAFAYRFGPPGFEVAIATLRDSASGARLAQTFFFPGPMPVEPRSELGLQATAAPLEGGDALLTVRTRKLALAVAVDARGFEPSDNYFNLQPGGELAVRLRRRAPGPVSGAVHALNGEAPVRIATGASP